MQRGILNKNNIIQFVLLVLVVLSSSLAWLGLRGILFSDGGWIMPVIAFFAVSVLLSVGWILLKSKIILLTVLLIILISFFLSFGFNWIYLIASLAVLLFFYFGLIRAMGEKDLRLKIKIGNILKQGLPAFFTGLVLLISVAYYFSPKSQISFQIPRPLFDSIMKVVPLPSNNNTNDLSSLESIFKMPIEGFDLSNFSIKDLPIGPVSPSLGGLGGSGKEQKDEIYTLINKIISDYTEAYKQYFIIGAAIGMFLTLKSISVIFMWLVILMGWLIFKILIILGVIKIQEQAALQEVIEI